MILRRSARTDLLQFSKEERYALVNGVLSVNNGFTGTITSTATFNNAAQTKEIDFEYDHNGLRTRKTVVENGITTIYDYTLHGKLITHMTKRVVDLEGDETSEELHFFYDAQSKPAFVEYGGVKYRYIHNLQGDIVSIVDFAGNIVVRYEYDAWGGSILVFNDTEDALGKLNPFRYRGYVYEEETGLLFVSSRYYSADIARFLNCDSFEAIMADNPDLNDKNIFAYCDNNPLTRKDEEGFIWNTLIGAALGGVVGGLIQLGCNIVSGEEDLSKGVLGAVVSGAASGALAASGVTLVQSIVANAGIAMLDTTVDELSDEDPGVNVKNIIFDGIVGGISGAVGGSGMSRSVKLQTLNKRLSKKLFSGVPKTALKAGKYYWSQTKNLYRKYLFRPMRRSTIVSVVYNAGKEISKGRS